MLKIERTSEITWTGTGARRGCDERQRRVLATRLPLLTRIGQPEGKTSPEELLAEARAV